MPEDNKMTDLSNSITDESGVTNKAETLPGRVVFVSLLLVTVVVLIGVGYSRGFTNPFLVSDDSKTDKIKVETISQNEQDLAGVDIKIASSTTSGEKSLGIYKSNMLNVAFSIPNGWEIVSSGDVQFPPGVSTSASFALVDKTNNCAITFGDFPYDLYEQVAFADRIYSALGQHDGSWYILEDIYKKSLVEKNFSTRLTIFPRNGVRISSLDTLTEKYNSIFLWC